MRLRGRFILSHLLPLLITTPLVAVALFYLLETQLLLSDMSTDLQQQARLIADVTGEQIFKLTEEEAQLYLNQISRDGETQTSVLLLTPEGVILASNQPQDASQKENLPQLNPDENHVIVSYSLFQPGVRVFAPVQGVNDKLVGVVEVADNLGSVSQRLWRLGQYILAVLGVQLLLGGLIGYWLATRLERPILATTTAVIDLAQGQYIEPPLPEQGSQETKALAQAVNTLSGRLHLLESTRRRSLANLVHEIGRPLGAIKAAVQVLREGADTDAALRQELLSGIDREIVRLQPLLDDLAQLHGQVTGQIQLHKEPVPLSEWLPPLLLPWRAAAQEKGLHWQADISPNLPTLTIDPAKMAQVMGNLLSNAIKYTPEGGTVKVTAAARPDHIAIAIEDNGPGIASAEHKRVFEPFYRSTAQRRFPQGLGLGLSIAQELVAAHGGTLLLNSQPGGGATFTVTLPYPKEKRRASSSSPH